MTVNGVTTDITNALKFTMPDADVRINAVFSPTAAFYYNVFAASDCYGTARVARGDGTPVEGGLVAIEGDTIRLTAEPNPGYRFKEWVAYDYTQPGKRVIFVGNKQSDVADIIKLSNNSFIYHNTYDNANELGESFKMPRVVLTAVFEPTPELPVTFNAGGGKGEMETETILPGETFTLPECNFAPDGCKEFAGWTVTNTRGGRVYQPGEEIVVNSGMTVTATWIDVDHIAVDGATITAPTCTSSGRCKLVCLRCGEDMGTRVIPARHDPVLLEYVAPTCAKTGLTEGERCSVCGTVFIAQQTIAKTDHTPGKAVVENKKGATVTTPASWDEVVYCTVCKTELSRTHKTGDTLPDVPTPPDEDTFRRGDVDNNGKIEPSDARLALRQAIGLEHYAGGSREFKACDVDRNGKVETKDARYILRKAVGLTDAGIWD